MSFSWQEPGRFWLTFSCIFVIFVDFIESINNQKGKEKTMHDIAIRVRCSNRYCEVLPDDVPMAECAVEELLSRVLLTFFEVVLVRDVSLMFWSASNDQESSIAISLQAEGYDPLPDLGLDYLDCAIVEQVSHALAELFGSLHVERFAMR
jgi:hypothetical protein